jgi:hypothetical protein
MKNYGRTTLSEFLADRVVYRKLVPSDPALPGLDELRPHLELPPGTPRKIEPDYARVIVALLHQARRLDGIAAPLERIIYLGDTHMLDGTAFTNICQAGGWPGMAFIASENLKEPPALVEQGDFVLSNRWAALPDFESLYRRRGFSIDERTAVVIDLDKTVLGARGRNGGVIDNARVRAVEQTVAEALGASFDPPAFRRIYDHLNQPRYHPFTADNQDYLAYICLILVGGLFEPDQTIAEVDAGRLASFEQFIERVESHAAALDSRLRPIHAEILSNVQAGDPTPFKTFRHNEYRETITRFGCLPDDSPIEALLSGEILITQEVRRAALAWRSQGATLFGLSDKPDEAALPAEILRRSREGEVLRHSREDEAALPDPQMASAGSPALHRAITHSVGE